MMSRGLFSVVIVLAFAGLVGYAAFATAKRAASEGKGGRGQTRA